MDKEILKNIIDKIYAEIKEQIQFFDIKVSVLMPSDVLVVTVTDVSAWKALIRSDFKDLRSLLRIAFGKERKIVIFPPTIELEAVREVPEGGAEI